MAQYIFDNAWQQQRQRLAALEAWLDPGTTRHLDALGVAQGWGEAQLNNRLGGAMLHIAIDCLKVVGNVAIISGTVTRSNLPAEVGRTAGFAVEDNGAGKNAPPDRITLVATFPPQTTDCTHYEPAVFDPYFLPIDDGNVQVR